MFKTIEAEVDAEGRIRSDEGLCLAPGTKILVTVLGEVPEPALLSEASLAEDWARQEEDAAWAHLNLAP